VVISNRKLQTALLQFTDYVHTNELVVYTSAHFPAVFSQKSHAATRRGLDKKISDQISRTVPQSPRPRYLVKGVERNCYPGTEAREGLVWGSHG